MEPSLQEILELAGDASGSKEVSVGGWRDEQNGGVSLAQTPRMLDKQSFLEEPHLTVVTFCYICIY